MKTFKKSDGSLHAFEDNGSQDHLITSDMVLLSDAEVDAIVNPPPTPAQIQAALEALIQQRLDAKAQSMNFDNLLSGIANASLPVGEYRQADGAALLLWRARTWQKAAEIRDAYLAGGPEPTWADVEAQLPGYPITA